MENKQEGTDFAANNLLEAVNILKERGYKIAKSKLYKDKDRGLIRTNKDGSVPIVEIDAYITRAALKIKPDRLKDIESNQSKKIEAELRNEQLRGDKLEIEVKKLRGDLVDRRSADERTVQALLAFFALLRSRFFTDAMDILSKVGGDSEKADILRKLLESILNDALHEGFAEGEIIADIGGESVFDVANN